jgi:hypothetical protein
LIRTARTEIKMKTMKKIPKETIGIKSDQSSNITRLKSDMAGCGVVRVVF